MDNQPNNQTDQNQQPAPVAPPDPTNSPVSPVSPAPDAPQLAPEPIQPAPPQPQPGAPMPVPPPPTQPVQPQASSYPPQPGVGYPNQSIGSAPPRPGAPMPGTQYQMPAKKKLSSGALFGIIAGAVGLVLIVAGVVLAVVFSTPSQEDYKAAADKLESMSDINRDIASAMYTLVDDGPEEIERDIAALRTASQELSEMRAVKPSENRQHYLRFASKLANNLVVIEDLIESNEQTALVTDGPCSDDLVSGAEGGIEAFKRAVDSCIKVIDEVAAKSSSQDLKDYMNRIKGNIEVLADATIKINSLDNPYGSDYDTYRDLRAKHSQATSDLSAADRDYQDIFRDRIEKTDPSKEAAELHDFLADKANGIK